MYKGGEVFIQSDLLSKDPNVEQSSLFFNATAAAPAPNGTWHYAEMRIDGNEISPFISSDGEDSTGNIPTYIAKLMVDDVLYDGMPAGDIRVPLHPETLANGGFFIGGEGCETGTVFQGFKGYIDEVRVFKGVVPSDWFHRLAGQSLPDPVAHYRMSSITTGSLSQSLYQMRPVGPYITDHSAHGFDAVFYEYGAGASDPKYEYRDSPWEAATTNGVGVEDLMLFGSVEVTVTGYNIAESQWLGCSFYGSGLTEADAFVTPFTEMVTVPAKYVDETHVSCVAPGAPMPGLGYVQVTNPKANKAAGYTYMESSMNFEGDQVKNQEVIGGTANEWGDVQLECPAGMRMDKVLFASYGRPKNRCNAKNVTNCDLTKTLVPCDYLGYEIDESCHSDVGRPPYFTMDIVEKHCLGKTECSIPARNEVFGDPCSSKNKWLSVALRCSDRWVTKDYVQADAINAEIATEGWSFAAWVYPHSKQGVQSIMSMGGASGQELLNRHILQWRGENGNTGQFYYYDDCIYDVSMKYADGRDIVLASNQWYHIVVTKDADGAGKMYLNDILVADFTTACNPDPNGNFFLGIDLDDAMYPKEYFDGLMDEVMVYKYALPGAGINMCWADLRLETWGLVAYYKFNEDLGELTPDSMGNVHGVLASSVDTIWDVETESWTAGSGATVHTDLHYVGAPWYPTHTFDVSVPGSNSLSTPAPLMGGDEVTIKGLNFAPINSRVFYGGDEILYEYVDHTTMTATIPDLKVPSDCVEGGTEPLEVVNSLGGGDSGTCSVGGKSLNAGAEYTQALDVPDLQQGLICFYPFYSDPMDYSGDGKHGTVVGATLVENHNGYPTQAYSFGTDDYISISGCTAGKTVAMWIYYEDLPFPDIHYLNAPFAAYEHSTGCQASDLATVNNVWTHVVGVVDGGVVTKTYVNGKPSSNTKYSEQILSVLVDKSIGGGDFVGKVDDVRVWDRVLCDSEIVATYDVQEYALDFGEGTSVSISMEPSVKGSQGSSGLLASFYGGGIEHFEVVDVLEQDFGDSAPSFGFSVDEWSVELTGYIYAPVSAEFYFTIEADDSFRLWINKGVSSLDVDWITTNGPVGKGPWTTDPVSGLYSSPNSHWVNVINEPCLDPECPRRTVSGNIELPMGWYEIYMSYNDKKNNAFYNLKWQTTDYTIPLELIPKEYLRSGTGPFTVEAWIFPHSVDGDQTVISRLTDDGILNGLGVGITNGGMSASVYTGCACTVPKCDEYREVSSWKTVIQAGTWQHIAASYDGSEWRLYVNAQLLDVIYYPNVKFFPETTQPIILGTENSKQIIVGSPDEVRPYNGLLYSFAMFNEAVVPTINCPLKGTEKDLISYLQLNEGYGHKAYDFAQKTPVEVQFQDGVITPPPRKEQALWVNVVGEDMMTCGTWETDFYEIKVAGTALTEAIAGHCSVFTIVSFDKCGYKRISGGDDYKIEIIGPLHLHTEKVTLNVGNGIVDHDDGSYTVDFVRETSGYYMVKVFIMIDGNYEMRDAWKTYVHPYISDPTTTYMYDDIADPLYLNELEFSMAGIPVSFKLQTVDKYGNLRTVGGVEDWDISFVGPYDFSGTWEDNNDGSYTFSYNAHVAGDYKMIVKMYGEPICMYGGRTCCGKSQSAYEYCTLQHQPEPAEYSLAFEPCTFCITVYDGSSLLTNHALSTYATFPDTDPLDLENPFTIFAFIQVDGVPTGLKQNIITKQSEYSGKGYWVSLYAENSTYTLEGGVYVGTENFRIARSEVTMETGTWYHVGLTYSGNELMLYLDAQLISANTYYDEDIKMNKRNSQPVKVGQGFGGMVDNVMIFSEVRPVEKFISDSFCPANMLNHVHTWEKTLIAYYRFNENSGFATKDSSHYGNDGIVGLVCDIAPEGKSLKLMCPDGYHISEVLYANFGENDGTCGAYTVGDCHTENSVEIVEAACLGQNSCTIHVDKHLFNENCPTSDKSLAVNAVCGTGAGSWSLETAPTLLTTTSAVVEDFSCPVDLIGTGAIPAWVESGLNELTTGGADCKSGTTITSAEAGKTVVWGLVAKDGCGYRSLLGVDSFEGEIVYPLEYDMSSPSKCPDFEMVRSPPKTVEFTAASLTKNYCHTFNDQYVLQYTADVVGTAAFTLSLNGAALLTSAPFTVVPAPISPLTTFAEGSGLHNAEAGIQAMFTVTALDAFGNLRAQFGDEGAIKLSVQGPPTIPATPTAGVTVTKTSFTHMELGVIPGTYFFFIFYPMTAEYNVLVDVTGSVTVTVTETATISQTVCTVTPTMIRPVTALNAVTPPARYEHSAVEYQDSVYFFGGSSADKTYLDETVKFSIGYPGKNVGTTGVFYSYRKMVNVENMPATDYSIELLVDTAHLIEHGKLKPDCSDMRFFLKEGGEHLPMWVEPAAAPAGCNKVDTVVWIKVPGGVSSFYMYYGNKAAPSVMDPASVFELFEDFEMEGEPTGWTLEGDLDNSCDYAEGYNPGSMTSFYTSEVIAAHGKRSLKVDTTGDLPGGSIQKTVNKMGSFTMKAYMYDSGCAGGHWISPDFESCTPVNEEGKSMLPTPNTGMGIYTASDPDVYCTTYPWHSSPSKRSVGWHSMTFRDDDVTLLLTMDEYTSLPLTKRLNDPNDVTTDITKVFLRGEKVPDQEIGSSVYWDAILVTAYDPTVSTGLMEEENVNFDPTAEWSAVGAIDPPPARQAHTAVVYDDGMYVFGGERSAYEYSDLWKYTFATDSWEFQFTANSSAALGRHDHSAVVFGDAMYVYGGRSPAPLGDMWKYNFVTMTWTEMPSNHGMAPRFGHSAAVNGDSMYVYGGFVVSDEGAGLVDEIWSYSFTHGEWTKVGPRLQNFDEDYVASPTDAIVFPMEIPAPRFAHAAVLTGKEPALYAIGGAGGLSMGEALATLWKFDLVKLEWTLMMEHPLLGRFDSSAVLFGGGKFALVYGGRRYDSSPVADDALGVNYAGHAAKKFLDDMFILFLGETGL